LLPPNSVAQSRDNFRPQVRFEARADTANLQNESEMYVVQGSRGRSERFNQCANLGIIDRIA